MPSTCGSSGEQALCNYPFMSDENVCVLESRHGAVGSKRPLGRLDPRARYFAAASVTVGP
jgi:hypothetical protein